jgi:hypothetical protein
MSKQMELEELVLPMELCKKIPAGEFEDSCFVRMGNKPYTLIERRLIRKEFGRQDGIYPAPTLQEIMAELPPGDTACFCCYQGDGVWSMGDCECDLYVKNGTEDSNPAAAALKVWLEMKGIK